MPCPSKTMSWTSCRTKKSLPRSKVPAEKVITPPSGKAFRSCTALSTTFFSVPVYAVVVVCEAAVYVLPLRVTRNGEGFCARAAVPSCGAATRSSAAATITRPAVVLRRLAKREPGPVCIVEVRFARPLLLGIGKLPSPASCREHHEDDQSARSGAVCHGRGVVRDARSRSFHAAQRPSAVRPSAEYSSVHARPGPVRPFPSQSRPLPGRNPPPRDGSDALDRVQLVELAVWRLAVQLATSSGCLPARLPSGQETRGRELSRVEVRGVVLAGRAACDAGGEIRTHTPLRAEDFKSPASTVPPPRRGRESTGLPAVTRRAGTSRGRRRWVLGSRRGSSCTPRRR